MVRVLLLVKGVLIVSECTTTLIYVVSKAITGLFLEGMSHQLLVFLLFLAVYS
jgi:hypothetical protein